MTTPYRAPTGQARACLTQPDRRLADHTTTIELQELLLCGQHERMPLFVALAAQCFEIAGVVRSTFREF